MRESTSSPKARSSQVHRSNRNNERSQSMRTLVTSSPPEHTLPRRASTFTNDFERGDSVQSLGMVTAAPAEITRPPPQHRPSPARLSNRSLNRRRAMDRKSLSRSSLASDRSTTSYESNRSMTEVDLELETMRLAEEAQEEELVRLAMERSMSEVNNSNTGGSSVSSSCFSPNIIVECPTPPMQRTSSRSLGDCPRTMTPHQQQPQPPLQRARTVERTRLRGDTTYPTEYVDYVDMATDDDNDQQMNVVDVSCTAATDSGPVYSSRSLGEHRSSNHQQQQPHDSGHAASLTRSTSLRSTTSGTSAMFDLSPRDPDEPRVLRIQPTPLNTLVIEPLSELLDESTGSGTTATEQSVAASIPQCSGRAGDGINRTRGMAHTRLFDVDAAPKVAALMSSSRKNDMMLNSKIAAVDTPQQQQRQQPQHTCRNAADTDLVNATTVETPRGRIQQPGSAVFMRGTGPIHPLYNSKLPTGVGQDPRSNCDMNCTAERVHKPSETLPRKSEQPLLRNAGFQSPKDRIGAKAIDSPAPRAKSPETRAAIDAFVMGTSPCDNAAAASGAQHVRSSGDGVPPSRVASLDNRGVDSGIAQPLQQALSTKAPNFGPKEGTPTRSTPWRQLQKEEPNRSLTDWPKPGEQEVTPNFRVHQNDAEDGLSKEEIRNIEEALRASEESMHQPKPRATISSDYDLSGAEQYLSEEELMRIQIALGGAAAAEPSNPIVNSNPNYISDEDAAAIARAIKESEEEALARADDCEEKKSRELAMQMQKEEELHLNASRERLQAQGNVRTMTRAEYEMQSWRGLDSKVVPPASGNLDEDADFESAGYRINSTGRQQWCRRDHASIVGPNNEVRTKHDTRLNEEANAHRLGLEPERGSRVGNKAYNSFLQSVKATKKGVTTKGTGRAGSDSDATRAGVLDLRVRSQISKAINKGLIETFNGVVKEGKEAVVHYASKGRESGDFDVAVKVFKRIQEFRARGDYVDGDPRYGKESFRNSSSREQLEIWAEKEFRNLTRANKAGVPVPTPLLCKENIIFMRFLGQDGCPAPQLREIELRRGSKRWITLHTQVLTAVKRLYQGGRLVHGDLSEYNIMVVPSYFVDTVLEGGADPKEELQAVLIDFGQAVTIQHPRADEFLRRDVERVTSFFLRQEVNIMSTEDALAFVLSVDDII